MQIQVNCTTNIACEWMLDYGGCEQLEKFLASAVFHVFLMAGKKCVFVATPRRNDMDHVG